MHEEVEEEEEEAVVMAARRISCSGGAVGRGRGASPRGRNRAGRDEREERDGKSGRRKDSGACHLIPHLFSLHVPHEFLFLIPFLSTSYLFLFSEICMFANWVARDARDGGLDWRSASRGAHPRSGLSRGWGVAATPA